MASHEKGLQGSLDGGPGVCLDCLSPNPAIGGLHVRKFCCCVFNCPLIPPDWEHLLEEWHF